MYSDNLIARPFPTWHLKPEIGEPAYEYFARLVEDEGHRSVTIYANEIGLTGRNLDPVELLESLDTLGYGDMYRERLRTFTPVPHGDLVALGNETLRPMQVSYTSRRFCPKCLAEKSYHRVWWDIVAFARCPEHEAEIVGETADGERLKWWFANMTVTPHGNDLVHHPVVHSPDMDTRLERAILRRLGIVHGPEPEMLIGRPLHEVIEVSTMLGKLLSPDREAFSDGFAPFTSTRQFFVETMRQWLLDHVSPAKRKMGFNGAYGTIAAQWNNVTRSKLCQDMCAGMRDALAPIGRLGRINAKKASTPNMELGLVEARKRLGMHKDPLKELAAHIGLDVGRYDFYFNPEAMERLEQALAEMVTLNETVAITGIATHEFSRLEGAGLIKGLRGVGRGGAPSRRYLRSEVEALVAKIVGDAPFASDIDATPLKEMARSRRVKQSALLIMAANGEMRPVCRDARYDGFASLCFELGELSPRRNKRPSRIQGGRPLTSAEVSVVTGLTKETVAALVKMDALTLVHGDSGQALVERKSFEAFHAEYASTQVYRAMLGCPGHMVAVHLRRRGVELGYRGTTNSSIVKRTAAREALDLDLDPDDASLHSFPAWDHFKEEVRRCSPSFFVQPVFIDTKARIATANNNVSLTAIRNGATSFELSFHVSELSARRWRMFVASSQEIMDASSNVIWEVSQTDVRGTLQVNFEGDVGDALNMLEVLNRHIKQR